MDIFSIVSQLCFYYRQINAINDLFVNKTADLIDKIGCSDFNAAIECMHDAEVSNNPEREYISALTLLKSSIEKLKKDNEYRFQGALIIGVCYKFLREETLSIRYLEMSKCFFREWIEKNRPVGLMSIGGVRFGYSNYMRYSDFKDAIISLGLKWRGNPSIPAFMSFNALLMNEDVAEAIKNAIEDYDEKLNHLFDPSPEYRCYCDNCGREVRLIERELQSNTNGDMAYLLLMTTIFKYKIMACENCDKTFFVNSDGKALQIDSFSKFISDKML